LAAETTEVVDEQAKNRDLAIKWLAEIERIRGKEDKWRTKAQQVIARYRDDRTIDDVPARFNMLWSNTEVIKPAIFSSMPVPDVRRRYSTKDPAARTAALILERTLSFCNSAYNFRDVLDRCNEDYVLPGRAMAVVCYDPVFGQQRKSVEPLPPSEPPDEVKYPEGTLVDAQGGYQMQEQKIWESTYCEYVPWKLFGFSECTSWAKVPAMWIGEYMTKDEVKGFAPQFTDLDKLPFKTVADNDQDKDKGQPPSTVTVWKVWHKAARKFMGFCEGYTDGPLLIVDDPQQLENFYPCPEPMYSLRSNGSWEPKPEFLLYQDQANELDDVTNRLRNLINACKNRGVYDEAMDQLAKISELPKKPDNTYIPVPNFSSLAEKGGLEGLISSLPLKNIVDTIAVLRERERELKDSIYEIYGISDIMRGASVASETLGAQELKAKYGGLRISTRQNRFQEFIRDIYRVQAEIISEHFSPDTLRLMSGIQVIPDQQFMQMKQQGQLEAGIIAESEFNQAIQILKSDKLRGFKVDIETDSTIPVDQASEQQNRVAFITALGTYLQGVIPAVESGAVPIAVAREAMLFVVRGFKVGSELEEVLEELGQGQDEGQQLAQLKQANAQMQEQMQAMQEQMQGLQEQNQTLQLNSAKDQSRAQADIASSQAKTQNDIALDNAKAGNQAALEQQKAQHEMAMREQESQHTMQMKQRDAEHARQLAETQAQQTAVEKANDPQEQAEQQELSALLQGQQQTTEAIHELAQGIHALLQHQAQPRKRSGSAKLPSGGTINFETMDS
jgi:hypothetical protein